MNDNLSRDKIIRNQYSYLEMLRERQRELNLASAGKTRDADSIKRVIKMTRSPVDSDELRTNADLSA